MSLIDILQQLISRTHNPELDEARRQHDKLPTSDFFKNVKISWAKLARDSQITYQRSLELGRTLRAAIEEFYIPEERDKVRDSLIRAMDYLGNKHRIFPDMDYADIWYTDHYDLIQLAKEMNLGDDTLPHWPEESNKHGRYLELTVSDLLQIFLNFSEEALLEEYKFGGNLDGWLKYVLRETLKTRQRFAREKRKQEEYLRFSPDLIKFNKNKS